MSIRTKIANLPALPGREIRLGPVMPRMDGPPGTVHVSTGRLLLSVHEVEFLLGIGPTSVYRLIKNGTLRGVKLGTGTFVLAEGVLRRIAELKIAR
jgi:excisionase family DNA binding protein